MKSYNQLISVLLIVCFTCSFSLSFAEGDPAALDDLYLRNGYTLISFTKIYPVGYASYMASMFKPENLNVFGTVQVARPMLR